MHTGSLPGDMDFRGLQSRTRRHGKIPPLRTTEDGGPRRRRGSGMQSEQHGQGQGAPKLDVHG